jgi:hypothetical protein
MTAEQRHKDNARSYAKTYKRRGHLVQQPCEVCRAPNTEMHHDDYDKPLEVRWLCRKHHLEHHAHDVMPKRKRQLFPRPKIIHTKQGSAQ